MDEDLSVKAPVTRLRRRLSVESEDSSLPTTPSTPTKKRATRLASKPQLELIDEVVTETEPKKKTRKAAIKEAEPDTNSGTPAPLTPSRRSTRIRSNTSILSETTALSVESPRAKRALRRTSQLGSDTESAAITPARQTRRNRRDSTTSVDIQVGAADENDVVYNVTSTITEPFTELPEKDYAKDSKENETNNHSPSTRKSPRLQKKKGGKADDGTDIANKEIDNKLNDSTQNTEETSQVAKQTNKSNQIGDENKDTNASPEGDETDKENLVKFFKTAEITASNLSTSAIEKITNDLKNKRNRTKSWTTLSSSPSNAGFISDNEGNKDKKRRSKTPNTSITGSGDGLTTNYGNKRPSINDGEPDIKSPNRSINISTSSVLNTSFENKDKLTKMQKQQIKESSKRDTVRLFQNSPDNHQPLVIIEDSDMQMYGEDQCVPVVANPINESLKKREQSVEPMDIDESMPVNVTIDDFSDKSNTSKEENEFPVSKRKSSLTEKGLLKDESINKSKSLLKDESLNKSKRKSSVSIQPATETQKRFSIGDEVDKNESINKSAKNSSNNNSLTPVQEKLNGSTKDKSNRSSSFSEKNKKDGNDSRKSIDKSKKSTSFSFDKENDEDLNESFNTSNKKSSVSQNNSEINLSVIESRKSLEKSLRKSSDLVSEENVEILNQSQSKRKSTVSQSNSEINQKSIVDENNDSKTSNKSKRNSSMSQTESQNLEKSVNESKSTLVISQFKDVSTNETNNIMSPNVTNTNTNTELSKSVNGPDFKSKITDKKNLTLNYLTSTPIQQKSLQKLTMQINTSIISPGVENKNNTSDKSPKKNIHKEPLDSDETDEEIKFKNKSNTSPKKKLSRAPSSSESDSGDKPDIKPKTQSKTNKKSPALDSSDLSDEESDSNQKNTKEIPSKKLFNESKAEARKVKMLKEASDCSESSSDEDVSKDKSKIVDDEASDAGDDYESGDSQNEEDRVNEIEHEIVEKGETLDSEEELSNDSDYEKDSFLVSSDAEDDEMLSGTGDDLSLSDNELTMTAKSKKKFNERKLKQQKEASREMYEARHGKDKSANSSKSETGKSNKSKRQRVESSTSESENEDSQPKKSNRLRIDSSQDRSIVKSDGDESISIKKIKYKRLSESVCVDIAMNEEEISAFNQSSIEDNDPLTVAIKGEQKTPQKQFNLSTVAITDKEELPNETLDPLQATVAADDSDDSSSSDNMEIIQNYDSVLNKLSRQTNKIKTVDTSLNLNKKSKDSKAPVMDQLNLSQAKKSKINKNKDINEAKERSKVVAKEDEDSSDAIDLKLIFSEDSNDSEVNAIHLKPDMNKEPEGDFIPLKRTDAKTNIRENMDINQSILNVSKKNKKRTSSHCEVPSKPDVTEEAEDINIKIIVDTTGSHQEFDTSLIQNKSSTKNKNNKSFKESKLSESAAEVACTGGFIETPFETLFASEKKKKKKNKNKSFDVSDNNVENSFIFNESQNENKSKKKCNSTSEFVETHIENPDITIGGELPVNISVKSDNKKKKNKTDVSLNTEPVEETTQTHSAEKKSKKTSISADIEPQTQITEPEELPAATSMKREKKKNKKNKEEVPQTTVENTGEESDEAPMEMSYKSEKKSDATDIVTEDAPTSSENKKHKKNKKKKNKNLSASIEKSEENMESIEQGGDGPKSRKRKASGNTPTETEDNSNLIPVEPLTTSNEKKKRKMYLDDEYVSAYEAYSKQNNGEGSESKKSKKKKSKQIIVEQDEVVHNTKKRKYKDEDPDEKISKVSKQDSFDKIHVSRLPESIVNQLTEKPQNKPTKKIKAAIATMPFTVEEAVKRKNKPSNYLEQSVYLNDSPSPPTKLKQKRPKQKKPKVLPFIPTALTSDSGYTSKFNINVLPGETQFVAQASNVENFRESFLGTQRIKKLGTFERFKKQRSHKISKF